MRFIDSNIIAYAFYENEHQEQCRSVLRKGGITNPFALIEAFHVIELQTNREIAIKAIKGLLKSALVIVDVDINSIFEALRRAQKYPSLKFYDLIHYTVAQLYECESILSYDTDFNHLDIPREEP